MTDATWDGYYSYLFGSSTGDWNTPGVIGNSNWNPATLPTGTATFPSSGVYETSITFSAPTTSIQTIQFSGGKLYTFTLGNPASIQEIDILGSGLVNAAGQIFQIGSNNGSGTQDILYFSNSSIAGQAILNAASGIIFFKDNSSAATSQITTSNKGDVTFDSSATASDSTINNYATTLFEGHATAGNATIHTYSGGSTQFLQNSSGGTATFIIDYGGTVDISPHSGDVTVGTISGFGTIREGSLNSLHVANGSLFQTFGGVITDTGGFFYGGPGTLTLTGINTFTGVTTLTGGTLELGIGGSIAGPFAFQNGSKALPGAGEFQSIGSVSSAAAVVETLKLDGTNQIGGTISGYAAGDAIDFAFHTFTTGDHAVWTPNAANSGGTLSLVSATGTVITSLNLTGTYTQAQFNIASDGNGGTVFSSAVQMTPATIQNDYLAITRTALSLDQATTAANSINGGTQTETQYVNGLLSQVANTTIPAVAVEAAMYGATGTSAEITSLTNNFLPAQVANATQYGLNPLVYASEAVGLVFAFGNENSSTAFSNNFGPSNTAMPNTTAGDAAFAAAASTTIFGSASTANLVNVMGGFVSFWKGFFTANGVPGLSNATTAQIDLAARGTSWGDMVGVALANNLGPLQGQVTNFLEDAAQGSAVYGASLVGQPAHQPFQGG